MNPLLRNILAAIAGLILGNIVNMIIISKSAAIIPLPEGVDPNNFEDLKGAIHTFPLKNFIMPFLAHALGTLTAAWLACRLAISHQLRIAIIIGSLFLLAGILASYMIGGPLWFTVVDLVFAYFPFALLGWKLVSDK